jgi:hypothetical protein
VIENEWFPLYAPDGFSATAVYAGESPSFGETVARHNDIGDVQMAWDIEFEVVGTYRIRGVVFPLRVVVGRDGTVVFKETGEVLDGTEAAIQANL